MTRITTMLLGLGLLSACQTAQPAERAVLSADFGEATRTNMRIQAIAPTQDELENRFIPADRERAALALDAYKRGEVKDIEESRTSGGG